MPQKKDDYDPNRESATLLKQMLILQLFQLGVPQARIAKKVRVNINTVNTLLRGVKRPHGAKGEN